MKIKKYLVVMLLGIITLSLSACGKQKEVDIPKSENTLEAMFNDPNTKKILVEKMPNGCTVEANKNTLIYTFKLPSTVPVNEEIKTSLKDELNLQENVFQELGKGIKDPLNIAEIKIEIRYINPDGSEIYTHVFDIK